MKNITVNKLSALTKMSQLSLMMAVAFSSTIALADNHEGMHAGHDMHMNHGMHSMPDAVPTDTMSGDMSKPMQTDMSTMPEDVTKTNQQTHMHAHSAMTNEQNLQQRDALAMLKSQGFYAKQLHEGHADDPLLSKVMIDQLEVRDTDDGNVGVLEADAWLGYDLNKLWFKTDVEYADSEVHEASVDALYSHAISPYWDTQMGVRQHIKPESETWGVVALKGLAPYFFETDASLAVNKDGNVHANLTAEYEAMLTQKLVLSPELGINAYSKATDDVGKGISDASLGLRLRYEIKREFAPYIGVVSNWKLGDTADLVKANGIGTQETQAVAGVRIWF